MVFARVIFGLTIVAVLASCTSSLYPINREYATEGATAPCAGRTDLDLTLCQIEEKIVEIDAQHQSFVNKPEIFDIPLIAMAAGTAGLLLFDGGTSAIAAVGLGAGTTLALRTYLSPRAARQSLRRGSAGYTCLQEYGWQTQKFVVEFVPPPTGVPPKRVDRLTIRDQLATLLVYLRNNRDDEDAVGAPAADIDRIIESGRAAVALFDRQRAAGEVANARLRMSAQRFGLALVAQAEREDVDISAAIRSILATQNAVAAFREQSADAAEEAVVPTEGELAQLTDVTPAQQAQFLIAELTSGMVSLETLVSGYDTCIVATLADNALPAIELVFASVE